MSTTDGEFMTPDSLERICLGYEPRIFSETPFENPETRLWIFQYVKWAMLLDVASHRKDWVYSPSDAGGVWTMRPTGRKLCLDALQWLVRRRALRVCRIGQELRLAKGDSEARDRELRTSWAWLDEHTKDGDR